MVVATALIAVTASAFASTFAPDDQSSASARQAPAAPRSYGLGRVATADEIKKLDIDVMPDGRGLPAGRGTVAEGATIYAAKCRSCHGATGEGATAERLVGRESGPNFNFAIDPKLVKTVGNYWPYATTLYDYTFRAMPFMEPGTLTPNETYALVAYLLALNKIVPDDAVMDQASLPKVVMPARDRFVPDNRKGGKLVK
ncbi:MAG: cytochrome c [Acidobacteriota bacterium]|nr:cytochrome c [Acidobacteriota bacterium]